MHIRRTDKILLDAMKYDEHGWKVITDFATAASLMGLQGGFTQVPLFSLTLEQQGYHGSPQQGTWTEFSVGWSNVKQETDGGPLEIADAANTYQSGYH